MYLTRKTFVKNWLHTEADKRYEVTITKGGVDLTNILGDIRYIESDVYYWRKSNAIHIWFVGNVQHGKDDCNLYSVSHSDLVGLLEVINEVLDNRNLAEDLLPTQEGFFYGSLEYDDNYFDDLLETKEMLEEELKLIETSELDIEYYYQSSW